MHKGSFGALEVYKCLFQALEVHKGSFGDLGRHIELQEWWRCSFKAFGPCKCSNIVDVLACSLKVLI